MEDQTWFNLEDQKSRQRILPQIEEYYVNKMSVLDWQVFDRRLRQHFPFLFRLLYQLYGKQYDFFYHLEKILQTIAKMWHDRPGDLKELDARRESNPDWYHSENMLGGVCYADLFAGTLEGIRKRIPYFKEMGLTYLHLMPLFLCPEGNNDGGYAVSNYRQVNPKLGTIDELAKLSAEFRKNDISLVLDFIFNHTSNEHEWARKAITGDKYYQAFYF